MAATLAFLIGKAYTVASSWEENPAVAGKNLGRREENSALWANRHSFTYFVMRPSFFNQIVKIPYIFMKILVFQCLYKGEEKMTKLYANLAPFWLCVGKSGPNFTDNLSLF